MKDLIYREDAIAAVERVMLDAYGRGVDEAPTVEYHLTAALRHLPSAAYASYERRTPAVPLLMGSLKCTCGGTKVYYSRVEVGADTTVEELYCPECGIIMRAPHGMLDMLTENWRAVHMKESQLSKPLSLEEIKKHDSVWFEEHGSMLLECLTPVGQSAGHMWWGEDSYDAVKDYNKEWRCWAKRPTIEERKAATWEN